MTFFEFTRVSFYGFFSPKGLNTPTPKTLMGVKNLEVRDLIKLPDDLVLAVNGCRKHKTHIGLIKITNDFLPAGFSGVVIAKSSKNFFGFQCYITVIFSQYEIETMTEEELLNKVLSYFYHNY